MFNQVVLNLIWIDTEHWTKGSIRSKSIQNVFFISYMASHTTVYCFAEFLYVSAL